MPLPYDSDCIGAYLADLVARRGMPSQAELDTLARLRNWEAGLKGLAALGLLEDDGEAEDEVEMMILLSSCGGGGVEYLPLPGLRRPGHDAGALPDELPERFLPAGLALRDVRGGSGSGGKGQEFLLRQA